MLLLINHHYIKKSLQLHSSSPLWNQTEPSRTEPNWAGQPRWLTGGAAASCLPARLSRLGPVIPAQPGYPGSALLGWTYRGSRAALLGLERHAAAADRLWSICDRLIDPDTQTGCYCCSRPHWRHAANNTHTASGVGHQNKASYANITFSILNCFIYGKLSTKYKQ